MNKVGVVGLGAVGLPIATIFGLHFDVIGVDIDKDKVKGVNDKRYWGNLEKKIKDLLPESKLTASVQIEDLKDVDLIIIALPTTNNDFSAIENTLLKIDTFFDKDVVISSTVKPGFTREMKNKYKNITISFVPVRTFEGKAVEQFYSFPHLIGTFDNETYERISSFYQKCGCKTIPAIPPEKAELSKLFSNAYRQTQMGIANELGFIAQSYGFNPEEIFNLVNEGDPYRDLKVPGIWGGYCLPKDTKLIIKSAQKEHRFVPKILSATEVIRLEAIERKAHEILSHTHKVTSHSRNLIVGIEGITSKPIEIQTPDIRDSPVLDVIRILVKNGINVKIFDPNLPENKLRGIAKSFGVEATSKDEIKNCDVYLRYENYDLRVKKPEN